MPPQLPRHIHFVGALGRGMGAVLEAVAGFGVTVTGSDRPNAYGSKQERLRGLGISISHDFHEANLNPSPDLVVIGRAFVRGNPEVEAVLARRIPYLSFPEFLCFYFLNGSRNLLVAGSKGKTTTTAMLAHLLSEAGLEPGYLIGGDLRSGAASARLGSELHVLEADEYSTLWWNANAKFLCYRPEVLIITNIYPDHPDLNLNPDQILSQYRSLISQLPQSGLLVIGDSRGSMGIDSLLEEALCEVRRLDEECELPIASRPDPHMLGRQFVQWNNFEFTLGLPGLMNARNALCAVFAARQLGVTFQQAAGCLRSFVGVKGRLELLSQTYKVCAYLDCYGYLPESLNANLSALRALYPTSKIILVYQPILVDQLPASREALVSILVRFDAVALIDESLSASLTPRPGQAFMAGLADQLRRESNLIGDQPMSLSICDRALASYLSPGCVVLFSVHPGLEDRVVPIVEVLTSR